ncbi:MAG: peptidase M75 [Bacteroidaceae bacterium]|nr:peptidase M75 [Bacteroidaceae bacterium]
MKKNILILGTIAIALTAVSCSKNDNTVEPVDTMPEGTADVTINETDANFADYQTNWCNYAAAVSSRLKTDAETLYNAWNEGLNGGEAYQTTFKEVRGAYSSPNSCIEQIIDGCITIANEVGESKIGDPRDKWENKKYTEAVYAVESWYSYHSIQDYANNIRSIQNAFNCTYKGIQGSHSIAAYLNAHGASDLAGQVNAAITTAINSIEGMAAPFRSHIGNPSVITAMEACNTLKNVLKTLKARVEGFEGEAELKAIVADYVDVVVLPTYKDLKDANAALHLAVQNLAAHPTNAGFEQAATAWMAARQPWETSEAFLFGPVDELGLDPNMDSWPLDQDAIKNVLASGDFSGLDWEGDFDEENEGIAEAQSIRGFHTLEFLLFKNGQPRRIQ